MIAISRYGSDFAQRLRALGISSVRAPFWSPRANAVAERWVRSVRAECLDNMLILNERHLRRVLEGYLTYYNHSRPHGILGQQAPCSTAPPPKPANPNDTRIVARLVLRGLHHVYQRAA